MSERQFRLTSANIELGALRDNYIKINELTGAAVMPVIKANAYGHGALQVAEVLQSENAEILGVATIEEGVELRENGINTPILILGSIYPMENFEAVIDYGLIPTVASSYSASILQDAARRKNVKTSFHIKIDTGMGRIGVSPETAVRIWEEIRGSEFVECDGVFTHLARADSDMQYTRKQIERFKWVLDKIDPPRYIHAANTAGILKYDDFQFTLVRPGLAIYGLYPEGVSRNTYSARPVLSWTSSIVFIKEVPEGTPVSYGGTWSAPRVSKIATVCVGYADGYTRALSNRAEVIVKGRRCPVVGRVCMDMIMVDVTDAGDIDVGEEVILLGKNGDQFITAEDMACWADTINYEITTGISCRVPRKFNDG